MEIENAVKLLKENGYIVITPSAIYKFNKTFEELDVATTLEELKAFEKKWTIEKLTSCEN